MRRFLAVILSLVFAVCCLPCPVFAAEAALTDFADVPAGSWYEEAVALCAQEGLMVGTGADTFSPDATLTSNECAVLALRLYDLQHGGDGHFDPAPADWNFAVLQDDTGELNVQGHLRDPVWEWPRFSRVDDGTLSFRLETEEERAWGLALDYRAVTLTLNGQTFPGSMHLYGAFLCFDPDDFSDYRVIREARWSEPDPQSWWHDAWYYADQHDLRELTSRRDDRGGFADAIFAVTGELDPINDIFALPDTAEHSVLSLCRAGVLTGTDEHGTFCPHSTLTRAQAAAILARVLHPDLRQRYSIQPLETYENYTLTHLYDTEDTHPILGERVVAVDRRVLLALDGTVISPPEGWAIERVGANDVCVTDLKTAAYGVMDLQGQVTPAEWWEARERPGELDPFSSDEELFNGYRSNLHGSGFQNAQGQQVTPTFTWTGVVTAEGQSFVSLEGKVYRIEFEQ